MISTAKLVRIVVHNSLRNWGKFALSAFGIVVGIGSAVFFLGLATGVHRFVTELFPLERVEVIAPRSSIAGLNTTRSITDETVEKLKTYEGVEAAVPRMAIGFPVLGWGTLQGNQLRLDVVGDGIDPSLVVGEPFADRFKDWEPGEVEDQLDACGPPPQNRCDDFFYCDGAIRKCRHAVPIIISPNLLEIYNKQFATTHSLPAIDSLTQFALRNMKVHLDLGTTMFGLSPRRLEAQPREVGGILVGISKNAVPIGVTVPLPYVRRWNKQYLGDGAGNTYSSVVVSLKSQSDVAPFGAWIVRELGLRLEDSEGERFAMIIVVVTALFLLISLVIVAISAINIAHNFFMQVTERRREIGVMRAIGATRRDVRRVILGESALLGVVAGAIGVALGIGAAKVADWLAATQMPDFAFKPESFFEFTWWIALGALGLSVLFCVVGGFFPARRAAGMPPARALAQQ